MKLSVRGMRGRNSPMNRAPLAQRLAIHRLVERARAEEGGILEVRYSTYIGPGCAAEHGDITVVLNGRIWRMVMLDGTDY